MRASGATPRLEAIVNGRHLPALDGLRAVAVFVVMAYHFGFPVPAGLGVSAFFVLSGFLITWLLRKEQRSSGGVSIRRFYLRRVLRIFPAYYAFVALSLAIIVLRAMPVPRGLIGSALLYVTNYYNALHNHPDGPFSHLWSLAVEEQFYLIWPALFVAFARRRLTVLGALLVAVIGGVLLWRSIVYWRTGNIAYVYNAFDTRFDNIAVGCLLAVCVEQRWFTRFADWICHWSWLPLITLAIVSISQSGSRSWHYGPGFTIDAILLAVFMTQVVVLHRSRLWRWLQYRPIRYIGVISYPMYLYHQWGGAVGEKLAAPSAVQFVVASAATVAVAAASYHGIEQPFLKLKRQFEPPRAGQPASEPEPARAALDLGVATGAQ